ncbi:1,4-alpha-glucan branching enzyme, partial [Lactiplantibacillus pentosus]|uniref:GlgB N-terminal domain-containing protein n=1 Tax=Lactiplantibacillus pentosus TaxID=1589 RepID=UPI003140E10F
MVKQVTEINDASYLFNTGTGFNSQDYLGCHLAATGRAVFRVWAPHAKAVAVVGDVNDWQPNRLKLLGATDIWQGQLAGVHAADLYKFQITTATGQVTLKIDPFSQQFERKPGDASVVVEPVSMLWHDSLWLARRKKSHAVNRPI